MQAKVSSAISMGTLGKSMGTLGKNGISSSNPHGSINSNMGSGGHAVNMNCMVPLPAQIISQTNHFKDIKEARIQEHKNKFRKSFRGAKKALRSGTKLGDGVSITASGLLLSGAAVKAVAETVEGLGYQESIPVYYIFAAVCVPLCVFYVVKKAYACNNNSLLLALQDEFAPKLDALAAVLKNEHPEEKADILTLSAKLSDVKIGTDVHRDNFTKYYAELEKDVAGLLMIKTEEVQSRIKDILDPPDVIRVNPNAGRV